jgi:hypothetical protein
MNDEAIPTNVIKVKFPENLELTQFLQKLLRSRRKAEALNWLSASCLGRRRTIGVFKGAKPSIKWVKELYSAGAAEVIAADIKTNAGGNQHSDKIVVVLPKDEKLRTTVFQWCERQGDKVGYLPDLDRGEPQMYVYIG